MLLGLTSLFTDISSEMVTAVLPLFLVLQMGLAPSQFGPNRLQRPLPGLSASQHFFSSGGRAFCLFTVVGSHARRMATVPRAAALVSTISITDRVTLARQGGRP